MLKIRLLFVFFLILFSAIVVKLFFIQVLNANSYTGDYLKTNKIAPERGKILDRNLEPIVVNQPSYTLYVEPKKLVDKEEAISRIDSILHIGQATLEAKIDPQKDWVLIQNGLAEEKRAQLLKTKLVGIGFEEGSKRYYPESSLSAQLVGFVGKNNNGNDVGYFGVEGFYDKDLAGLPGLVKSEQDLLGNPIFAGTQQRIDPEDGRNLVLTIDKAIQHIVKTKLEAAMKQYEPKQGCVIVADPKTMEILGLSCLPDFDPDTYYKFTEEEFKDSAISDSYEPGSTFKPLVMAAAIEKGKLKPDDIYDESGPVTVGDYTIHTWDDNYEGKITMTRILEKSSNVGMVYVGQQLGNQNFYNYIHDLGFGQTTGIDLQGEVGGEVKTKDQWYPIDYATATFGQGIGVTPLQMLTAFSSVVNGGYLMKPHVVKAVLDGTNQKENRPEVVRRIFSDQTSAIMRKMLVSTVVHGEYKWAIPDGYVIGGKTGTAQIPIAGHYDPTKTIASFIGFAPAQNPKFIAIVVLKEPAASIWGSETAAPVFFDIAKDLLAYYNIPPSQ